MRPEDRDAARLWDMLQAAREVSERNILAHEYGQIDHELLYRTAVDDVPDLIRRLDSLLPSVDVE